MQDTMYKLFDKEEEADEEGCSGGQQVRQTHVVGQAALHQGQTVGLVKIGPIKQHCVLHPTLMNEKNKPK